ncbi:hypothetical protein [Robbsia andropogonis]|uniref:hypothetical protein n=1 Tax=Robbsia andropogonis TaxID=28092 RepID=UPI0004B1BD25|nr:hypothetical protein [Robbsia andropogonis]
MTDALKFERVEDTTNNILKDFDIVASLTIKSINAQLKNAWKQWHHRTDDVADVTRHLIKENEDGDPDLDIRYTLDMRLGAPAIAVDPKSVSPHEVLVKFDIAQGKVTKAVGKRTACLDLSRQAFTLKAALVQNHVTPEALYKIDAKTAAKVAALSGAQGSGAFTIECLFLNLSNINVVTGFEMPTLTTNERAQRLSHAGYAEKFLARPDNLTALGKELQDQFALFMRDFFAESETPDGEQSPRFLLNTTMRPRAPRAEPSLVINDTRFKVTPALVGGASAGPASLDYLCTVVDGQAMPADGVPLAKALGGMASWLTPSRVDASEASVAGMMVLRGGQVARLVSDIFQRVLPTLHESMEKANADAERALGRKVLHPETEYPYPEYQLLATETISLDANTNQISIRSRDAQNTYRWKGEEDGNEVDFVLKKQLSLTLSPVRHEGYRVDGLYQIDLNRTRSVLFGATEASATNRVPISGQIIFEANTSVTKGCTIQPRIALTIGDPVLSSSASSSNFLVGVFNHEAWDQSQATGFSKDIGNAIKRMLEEVFKKLDLHLKDFAIIPPGDEAFGFGRPRMGLQGDLYLDLTYRQSLRVDDVPASAVPRANAKQATSRRAAEAFTYDASHSAIATALHHSPASADAKGHSAANENSAKRFSTKDIDGKPVSFTVDSQLLDYLEPARTFGAADLLEANTSSHYQPTIIAIPDHRPSTLAPMLLTTGSQQKLQLVRRVGNGLSDLPANFETVDLSAGFADIATGKVRAFAAAWTADDKVTLAVAVDAPSPSNDADNGPSQILIAYDVSTAANDWSTLPWINYGARGAIRIDAMRVLREADGTWMTLMSGSAGVLANAYVLRQDRAASFQSDGMVYSTPIDFPDIVDFQVGAVNGAPTLHVLGTNHAGERVVVSREIPSLDQDGIPVPTPFVTLHSPADANVLATGPDRPQHGADLFIGGKGVKRLRAGEFARQEEAVYEEVMAQTATSGIERLVVAEAVDGAMTVWALDNDGRLLMSNCPAPASGHPETGRWSAPITLRRGVHEIAAVPGDTFLSASVLVIYDKGHASSLVRDAQGIWQDEPITVADAGAATRLLTFQTVVSLENAKGNPASGCVQLAASVPTTVVLNGHSHFIYPGSDAVIDIPYDGKITISNRALSFSPATYRLKVDNWSEAIDINPAARLYQRFDTLTADELRNAKRADGQPLLDEATRATGKSGTLDALVKSLKQAATLVRSKPGGSNGVWCVPVNSYASSAVLADTLPDDYSWGLASDGNGDLQAMDHQDAAILGAAAHMSSGEIALLDREWSLSDVWESIASAAGQAVRFVIRKVADVVEFVCEIAGKVGRFILSTLEEIGSFFKWLWSTIKTAAEDVWNFLKFLFSWDDIVAVRDSMKRHAEDQLAYLKTNVLKLKPIVASLFDSAIAKVQETNRNYGFPQSNPPVADTAIEDACKGGSDNKDGTVNSGPGSWIMEQFNNLANGLIRIDMDETGDVGGTLLRSFHDGLNALSNVSSNIAAAVKTIFPDGRPSIGDISLETLKRLVMAVGLNIAEGALQFGKALSFTLIEGLAALIDAFKALMFARISSPLLEKLWELIAGEKVDLSFSIIDFVLLPPALLTTLAFKLAYPKEDLQAVAAVKLPVGDAVAVQSSKTFSMASMLISVGTTFLSFTLLSISAIAATDPAPQLSLESDWKKKAGWTLGFLSHLFSGGNIVASLVNSTKAAWAGILEGVGWLMSLLHQGVKYVIAIPPALGEIGNMLFQALRKGIVLFELVVTGVGCLLKTIAMAIDDKKRYDPLYIAQFYCNTGSKMLSCFALLAPELNTKLFLCGGAFVAASAGLLSGLFNQLL